MQYINTFNLVLFVITGLSIFILCFSSFSHKFAFLFCSAMWFPFSVGLYFYNKLAEMENRFIENVIYGIGIFSALYIIFSLYLFYKNNKTKVQ